MEIDRSLATRRLLLQEIAALESGSEPYAAGHGDIYWVRSASAVLKRDVDFAEGARELLLAGR